MAIMVMGLRIGAANRKLMTSAGLRPCAIRLRATGTLPHSQTGKAIPSIDSTIRLRKAFFGSILSSLSDGKNFLISADTITPSIRNGVASTITLSVSVRKS